MKLLEKVAVLSSVVVFAGQAWAQDVPAVEDVAEEVKDYRGFVERGLYSDMGEKLARKVELTDEQVAALELGLAEIQANMPDAGSATTEEIIEARVAAHMQVKALFDSILTDEQKAALEAGKSERPELTEEQKAEREAKKAEREAAKAEREAKKAEREAAKAEREEPTEEQIAEWEAKKAEREARKAERAAERAAKKAEKEAEKAAEAEE